MPSLADAPPAMLYNAALAVFLGGETSTSALITSQVLAKRHPLLAYNAPGSLQLARALYALEASHYLDQLHSGDSLDPRAATATHSASPDGPKFVAAHSGTVLATTGDVAKIVLDYARTHEGLVARARGRTSVPTTVTILDLRHAAPTEFRPCATVPGALLGVLPALASALAAGTCARAGDPTSAALIALGMLANAAASLALSQSGALVFTRPASAPGAPPGSGYLESGSDVVILRGCEGAVAAATRGRLALRFPRPNGRRVIALCAGLYALQGLAQLLLLPLGTLRGQLYFLFTLTVGWLYNARLAAKEKDAWRRVVLDEVLRAPTAHRFSLGTRAAAATFVVAQLRPRDAEGALRALVPNDTPVWELWRRTVARALAAEKPAAGLALLGGAELEAGLCAEDQTLFRALVQDARDALDLVGPGY